MRIIHTLIASAALLGAGAVQAAMPTAISFDGYCDGITNIVFQDNGTVTGTWTNYDCLGSSGAAIAQRARAGGMNGQTGHYVDDPVLLVRINDDGTWTYYSLDGSVFNWGTWSDASMARAIGTRPSVSP